MDKKLARANMRFGIGLFVLLFVMLATTFGWAWVALNVAK